MATESPPPYARRSRPSEDSDETPTKGVAALAAFYHIASSCTDGGHVLFLGPVLIRELHRGEAEQGTALQRGHVTRGVLKRSLGPLLSEKFTRP